MKFSLIYEAQMVDTSRTSEAHNFHDMVEETLLAEQLGFDCVWAVEHTALTQYAHMSAPETFLAYIAGKTSRIHVGHGVVCLPFAMNHPIKVAERIATLDILSRGRLHFGVGKGGTLQEAGAFGNRMEDLQAQVDEAMYMIPKMWLDGEFSHDGPLLKVPPRPIWPKPYQTPHPPMYMACTHEESIVRAASRGIGALVMGFSGPDEIAKKNAIYRETFKNRDPAKQVGFRPTEHVAALCPAVVLNDRAEARHIGYRGQKFFAEAINYWYGGGPKPTVQDFTAEELKQQISQNKENLVAYLGQEKIEVTSAHTELFHTDTAYGTVDDAISYVERLQQSGADEILFLVQMGTIPHEVSMQTIRNIGEHLIPYFKNKNRK